MLFDKLHGMTVDASEAELEAMMACNRSWLLAFGALYLLNFNVSLFAFYGLNARRLIIWAAIAMVLAAILTFVAGWQFFYSGLV